MKGITGSLSAMKIQLKPDAKPVKRRPYRLNPKYKEKVRKELDQMLDVKIIVYVEESNWISPMAMQPKKTDDIRICVDLCSLNAIYVHDPFPTPFIDDTSGGEAYSFMDGFSRYHQVRIIEEDQAKTMFAMKWGSFSYTVMPFWLKNAPTAFSRIVVTTFKDFIHKFLVVYLDDWTVFNVLKEHMQALRLMLDRCLQLQISLNLKKCIFCTPFRTLIKHVVCKEGLLVDQVNIVAILDMVAPTSVKGFVCHIGPHGYYSDSFKVM
jgi:hypothetical protein